MHSLGSHVKQASDIGICNVMHVESYHTSLNSIDLRLDRVERDFLGFGIDWNISLS